MANETPAPAPQFRLTGAQMLALTVIEIQQAQLTIAANSIVGRCESEKAAAQVPDDAARTIEAAKLKWLRSTQNAIQLVPDLAGLPDRVKANGSHL